MRRIGLGNSKSVCWVEFVCLGVRADEWRHELVGTRADDAARRKTHLQREVQFRSTGDGPDSGRSRRREMQLSQPVCVVCWKSHDIRGSGALCQRVTLTPRKIEQLNRSQLAPGFKPLPPFAPGRLYKHLTCSPRESFSPFSPPTSSPPSPVDVEFSRASF